MKTEPPVATRSRKPKRAAPLRPVPNAITLLKADHAELQQMFTAFENTRSVNNKRFLVQRICTSLAVHERVKDEVFYPAVESVLPRAKPEPGAMNELVVHIQSLEPVAELVDEPIMALAAHVNQHANDMQDMLFPHVRASGIDLVELGQRMSRRKAELMQPSA